MNTLKIFVNEDFFSLPALLTGETELFLIYDANVESSAKMLISSCEAAASAIKASLAIQTSEAVKTMDTVMSICSFLLDNGASRKALVLALGGGITTDMAGFAASIYKRGVRFANIPTTLLAQVDAAIGGKTGVNFEHYKNILGVINQPEFTYMAGNVLNTLGRREYLSGVAELLKTFIIADAESYARAVEDLRQGKPVGAGLIEAAARIKAGVVERDEKENGERRNLNLGHTVAHAIEWWQGEDTEMQGVDTKATDYSHGEAVAIGMVKAAELSEKLGYCKKGLSARIKADLEAVGLPTECPISVDVFARAISQDKKAVGDSIWFVLIRSIGRVEARYMPLDEVIDALR